MYDVVTIGSATRDAFFSADFPTVLWPKTPSRRAYVLPLGEKLAVKDVFFTIGGNAANAGVTFARQGFKTACVAKTGWDVSAEEIRRRLAREGVETRYIAASKELSTSYSVLLLEKGERTILNYHGAADTFSLGDEPLARLKAKWWYVSLPGESCNMFSKLVRHARKNNIAVAFNPSGYHLRYHRRDILRLLRYVSFLVLNGEEAALLSGIPWRKEKEVFKKLDALMPGILAVTLGRGGVVVSDGNYLYRAGIFKEKKLVDRTGAGDAFGAGFVAGLIKSEKLKVKSEKFGTEGICYAIRLASANATSVVEEIGATEGALTARGLKDPRWRNLKIEVKTLQSMV